MGRCRGGGDPFLFPASRIRKRWTSSKVHDQRFLLSSDLRDPQVGRIQGKCLRGGA